MFIFTIQVFCNIESTLIKYQNTISKGKVKGQGQRSKQYFYYNSGLRRPTLISEVPNESPQPGADQDYIRICIKVKVTGQGQRSKLYFYSNVFIFTIQVSIAIGIVFYYSMDCVPVRNHSHLWWGLQFWGLWVFWAKKVFWYLSQ